MFKASKLRVVLAAIEIAGILAIAFAVTTCGKDNPASGTGAAGSGSGSGAAAMQITLIKETGEEVSFKVGRWWVGNGGTPSEEESKSE